MTRPYKWPVLVLIAFLVGCHTQADTSLPLVPSEPGLPDDSTFTVASPSGTETRYHRNIVGITLDDTTSGTTFQAILSKYAGSVIGGSPTTSNPVYFVQIPDPGPTFEAMDSVRALIEAEPGVKYAYNPTWRARIRLRSRYPSDGPRASRTTGFFCVSVAA